MYVQVTSLKIMTAENFQLYWKEQIYNDSIKYRINILILLWFFIFNFNFGSVNDGLTAILNYSYNSNMIRIKLKAFEIQSQQTMIFYNIKNCNPMKIDGHRLPSLFEMYLTLRTKCKMTSIFGERKRGSLPLPLFLS